MGSIDSYFKRIGWFEVKDLDRSIRKSFKTSQAESLIDEWEKLCSARDENKEQGLSKENVSRQSEIVDFTHSSLKMSLLFSSYYDLDVYKQFFEAVEKRKDFFGKNIIDDGCGNGIITCYLAMMLPDRVLCGVDVSENAIRIANILKDKLKLKNVGFYNSDNIPDFKYDTLVSVRTFHENISTLWTNASYYSFEKQLKTNSSLYDQYIKQLSNLLNPTGNLIAFERGKQMHFVEISESCKRNGINPILQECEFHKCIEASEERDLFLLCASKSVETYSYDQLIGFIYEEYPYGYSGAYAEFILEKIKGLLIDAFISVDDKETICGIHALYNNAADYSKFILFQKNKLNCTTQIFDKLEDMDEAEELMKESRKNDQLSGFKLFDTNSDYQLQTLIEYLNKTDKQ